MFFFVLFFSLFEIKICQSSDRFFDLNFVIVTSWIWTTSSYFWRMDKLKVQQLQRQMKDDQLFSDYLNKFCCLPAFGQRITFFAQDKQVCFRSTSVETRSKTRFQNLKRLCSRMDSEGKAQVFYEVSLISHKTDRSRK